jgi:transposase-like protein
VAGRRVQDEEDARACLRAAEASGLQRAEWAREHGVEPRSLNAWRVNLARAARRLEGGMVELVAAPSRAGSVFTVRSGPFSVEVAADFDGRALARLLAVVAAC